MLPLYNNVTPCYDSYLEAFQLLNCEVFELKITCINVDWF